MTPSKMTFHSFKRCNMDELNSDYFKSNALHATSVDVFDDINDRWECWKKLFCEIIDMHAPVITVCKKKESQLWITSDIHHLMWKRNYYKKKHQKNRDPVDWKCYVHLRNLMIKKLRQAKTSYMTAICKDIAHSPKKPA